MKASIWYRKLKFWPEKLLENICHGLIRQDFKIEINKELPENPPNLLIQWFRDNFQYLVDKKWDNTKIIMIELGWFSREKNLLLYNKDDVRYPPILNNNYMQFFKKIPDINKKVWLILGQMPNDKNLSSCDNYSKWINDVTNILKTYGNYPVRFRAHPESDTPSLLQLDEELGAAIGVVSWNSSSVLKAMMHRIPVCIYDFPEIENECKKELTKEWIIEVEKGLHREDKTNILNYIASQQINIDCFRILDYIKLYRM